MTIFRLQMGHQGLKVPYRCQKKSVKGSRLLSDLLRKMTKVIYKVLVDLVWPSGLNLQFNTRDEWPEVFKMAAKGISNTQVI